MAALPLEGNNGGEGWPCPTITEQSVAKDGREGLLPPSTCYEVAKQDGVPDVPEEYTVVLPDQLRCGLGFPPSDF